MMTDEVFSWLRQLPFQLRQSRKLPGAEIRFFLFAQVYALL
jgi:hypothetical protein